MTRTYKNMILLKDNMGLCEKHLYNVSKLIKKNNNNYGKIMVIFDIFVYVSMTIKDN